MDVTLTRSHQNPPTIRQATPRRDWMDDTYNKHAYKCLPLTEANVNGWELVLQQDVVVQWDGVGVPQVLSGQTMSFEIDGHSYERDIVMPSIVGIMSFCVGWTFHTPPGIETWISGSPNLFIDGAVPLTANIPSDWWPDEFNMNWKITKVGSPVTFPAGSPFMFFQFYKKDLMPSVDFTVNNMWDDDQKELNDSRQRYSDAKMTKLREQPWTWMGGIRTGLDADGQRIGPEFSGHPKLKEPDQ